MSKIKALFLSSAKEFTDLRCIILLAMFGAISVAIGLYTLNLSPTVKITFTFIPNNFAYYLFGPFVGIIYGAAMDVLNYFANPSGEFFFGFTASAVVSGLIYGLLLYKRPLSMKRIIVANIIKMLTVDILMNTLWLSMLYGNAFMVLLPVRALKELIMLPVETIVLFSVIKGVEATGVIRLFHNKETQIL